MKHRCNSTSSWVATIACCTKWSQGFTSIPVNLRFLCNPTNGKVWCQNFNPEYPKPLIYALFYWWRSIKHACDSNFTGSKRKFSNTFNEQIGGKYHILKCFRKSLGAAVWNDEMIQEFITASSQQNLTQRSVLWCHHIRSWSFAKSRRKRE